MSQHDHNTSATAANHHSPTLEIDLSLEDEDAFWSLLWEQKDLRSFVDREWREYIARHTGLHVIARERATACHFGRLAVQDFETKCPNSKLFTQLIKDV